MPTRITDHDRAEAPQVEVGQRVCIVGRGMDSMVHRHQAVARVTATMIVTASPAGVESRFNRDRMAMSIPHSPYGGTSVHTTCQRAKPKTES